MFNGWPKTFTGSYKAVIVHTKTDRTIRGLLASQTRDMLVLRPASIASEDQNHAIIWSKIDGDVVIMMENIDFWQEGVEASLAGLTSELFVE